MTPRKEEQNSEGSPDQRTNELRDERRERAELTQPEKDEKEYTSDEVADHNTEDDCWMVIGSDATGGPKVYDVTSYLDDHPGGAEVMLDVGGQDADEFFEDIGHSSDAREELKKYFIGHLKLTEEEKEKKRLEAEKRLSGGGGGGTGVIAVIGVLIAAGYYYYKSNMVAEE